MEQIIALITLVLLVVILGINNIMFISILAARLNMVRNLQARLQAHQQKKARKMGILLAMFLIMVLLTIISLMFKLQEELFNLFGNNISSKDLIIIGGGLFLMYKSTAEVYNKIEGETFDTFNTKNKSSFLCIIVQILILYLIFSIDSIITAVGMVNELWIMYAVVILAVIIMLVSSEGVNRFIHKHPAFKILALSFLLFIGLTLIGESLDFKIPKGYVYFPIAFSLFVTILQVQINKPKESKIPLKKQYLPCINQINKGVF